MTQNFTSSLSLTSDFGNVVANSTSAQFTIISKGIAGSATFDDVDISSLSLSQLWFSLPNTFPCNASNVIGELDITCASPSSSFLTNKVLVFRSAGSNTVSAWMPFFDVSASGNLQVCDFQLEFQGLFS